MFMLSSCFRSSRAFILVVLLFCTFSEAALAARRSGSFGPFFAISVVVATIASAAYIFGDTSPVFELPDHNEINPRLYLKYARQDGAHASPDVPPRLDSQHRILDENTPKRINALILPVQLKKVSATPEIFAARNNKELLTEEIMAAGVPDNWNAYLRNKLFWKLHPLFVELGRDQKKMHPYYRPVLSTCLDFTGDNQFSAKGILSECANATRSRLKGMVIRGAGIYAIANPGAGQLQSIVEKSKKIRLPVYSLFDSGIKVNWELFYVSAIADGEYDLISVK